jgi:hypothetical protein
MSFKIETCQSRWNYDGSLVLGVAVLGKLCSLIEIAGSQTSKVTELEES